MAIIKKKPTSAGTRFVVKVRTDGLHKGKPVRSLVENLPRMAGATASDALPFVTKAVAQASIPSDRLQAKQGRRSWQG